MITGLIPGDNVPVYYIYGSDDSGWADEGSFAPPPIPSAETTVRIILTADVGMTEYEEGVV